VTRGQLPQSLGLNGGEMDGWLGFNGILSTQVAAISCWGCRRGTPTLAKSRCECVDCVSTYQ